MVLVHCALNSCGLSKIVLFDQKTGSLCVIDRFVTSVMTTKTLLSMLLSLEGTSVFYCSTMIFILHLKLFCGLNFSHLTNKNSNF